jgi:putative ABC transport system ATP-binding protein
MDFELEEQFKSDSNSNPLLLEIKQLTHNFDYPLFENLNFDLHSEESIAIIGASGCGKSTLLNILSSLLKPKSGYVQYKNNDIYKLSNKDLIKIRRDEFGIIFQSHYLFRGFNTKENLEISEFLSGEAIDYELLKSLKIEHIINQGIGEISGGQQQRVSIARVLNKKPKIIFADEPTGNLDKETASEVMSVVFDYLLKEKAGMILVTHELDLANQCNKIYKLNNTRLERIK